MHVEVIEFNGEYLYIIIIIIRIYNGCGGYIGLSRILIWTRRRSLATFRTGCVCIRFNYTEPERRNRINILIICIIQTVIHLTSHNDRSSQTLHRVFSLAFHSFMEAIISCLPYHATYRYTFPLKSSRVPNSSSLVEFPIILTSYEYIILVLSMVFFLPYNMYVCIYRV